ncbi:hypothetical protein OIU74_011779 [Salix koriyanagi]|uniref:Uncharacterized protein n=1 Tax=Salix koriyanagi TaxID=2511006 RepID=A0A9Q0YV01_9ROSI|nr:hypothetical protein OIU74_011779 [Salix koriyanagi]
MPPCELKSPPLLRSQETRTCLLSTPTSNHSSIHRPFTLPPAPPFLRKPPIRTARNPIPQNPNSNPARNRIRNMDPKPQTSGRRYRQAETLIEEVIAGACEMSVPLYNSMIRFCCGRDSIS